MIAIIIIAVIAIILVVVNIRVVQQARAFVIERLGAYKETWNVGLHVKMPFIDRVAKIVSLKEQVADFPPQPVITKDNVTMQIDTVVYFQITDPDPWGIKVNRVELKNILPPKEIQNAMEKQMKAERERREAILRAEGEKRAAILEAEGEKESAILRADAKKQQQILEAEGEAQAILKVQTATAEGIRLINEAAPSEAVLRIKALEAFSAAANGTATKIIIPSEIQGLAGLAEGVIESVKK